MAGCAISRSKQKRKRPRKNKMLLMRSDLWRASILGKIVRLSNQQVSWRYSRIWEYRYAKGTPSATANSFVLKAELGKASAEHEH